MISKLTVGNKCKLENAKITHDKKLKDFGVAPHLGTEAGKVIFNFSDRVLNEEEENVLKLGLIFDLPFKKTKFVNHFLAYEKVVNNLSQINRQQGVNEHLFREATSCIKTIANDIFNSRCNI